MASGDRTSAGRSTTAASALNFARRWTAIRELRSPISTTVPARTKFRGMSRTTTPAGRSRRGVRSSRSARGKTRFPWPCSSGRRCGSRAKKPGTYWVHWRAHYFAGGTQTGAPTKIVSGLNRIFVNTSPGSADESPKAPGPGWLQIQPHGTSFISAFPADFILSVNAHRPADATGTAEAQITVHTNHLHTEVKKLSLPLDFSKGDTAQAAIDLSSLPPGPIPGGGGAGGRREGLRSGGNPGGHHQRRRPRRSR